MKLKADNEAQCVEWVEGLNKWREWALTTGHGNEEPYSATGRNPFSGYSTEDSNSQVIQAEVCRVRLIAYCAFYNLVSLVYFLLWLSQRGDSVTSSLGMSDSEPSTPDRVFDRVSRHYNEGSRNRQPSGKQRKAAARRYPSRDSSQSSFDSLDYTPNSSRLKDSTPPRVRLMLTSHRTTFRIASSLNFFLFCNHFRARVSILPNRKAITTLAAAAEGAVAEVAVAAGAKGAPVAAAGGAAAAAAEEKRMKTTLQTPVGHRHALLTATMTQQPQEVEVNAFTS